MSEGPIRRLKMTTRHVSADGARVTPGEDQTNVPVTETEAIMVLRAFAGVSAVDLVEVEAKIYLTGPRGRFAVQNVGGKLFVALVPESVNTAAELTPEQAVALLTETDPAKIATAVAATATREAELIAAADRLTVGPRRWLNSWWTLGVLTLATAVLFYATLAPEVPADVAIVRDGTKISALNSQLNGRYGAPGATILELANGRLTGLEPDATGVAEEKTFQFDYAFGLRGQEVVIVVDNGALLELQPDHSLKFLESVYPRQR